MSSRKSIQALALMELLVAMALTLFVMGGIIEIYAYNIRRWAIQATEASALRDAALIFAQVEADLRRASSLRVESVSSRTVYTVTLPANTDASGNYLPQQLTGGLLYVRGARVRYYLSDTTGNVANTGTNLWRATCPSGSTTFTPDTSWSRFPDGTVRYPNVSSLTLSGSVIAGTVDVSLVLTSTEGTQSNAYSLQRQVRLLNSNATNLVFQIMSTSCFLNTQDPLVTSPRILALADYGLQPGDVVKIESLGGYRRNATDPDDTTSDMLCVFSSSSTLLAFSVLTRVTGALACDAPAGALFTSASWIPSDFCKGITGDFLVTNGAPVTVTVPAGATHLFVSALDFWTSDNDDDDDDFGVRITPQ